ncbi:EamA domain-containing membrane protein RarD [Meinhardsimonia xiamenensis]|jgi:drug/metabolite transporter (DMT)-like permease|uniref:EamA domain-containing membrane protein RarD n=1 Tax=Meinhardsimonia xiamenensis TaxID=990712 RepID=A0A1G9G0Y8_9RHOB|nr:DMT family transporter [Meinhardsimonia xiamenensis]PRX32727.1 EamA domain-containing membrane protein RarD [Meinhardsimonia xiamenensis]SDK94245.1 EamA domain-containing membrane protein RarD [Meinhardsimonia xiamenensis]
MTEQKSLTPGAWAELLALSTLWGGSFLAIRIALDEIGFVTAVAHRVVWAALILWAIIAWRGLALPRSARLWGAFLVMGLLNNVIPFSLMAWGQLHIESGLAAILNATTAIFGVAVAAAFFADERLTPRRFAGAVLGLAGVAVTMGLEALLALDLRSLAQLAVLGGAFSYSLASAWARARLSSLAPEVAAAGMLTGASLVMVPAALWLDGPPRLALEPQTWGAIGYYAVLATALAYLLYYRVLAVAGAGNLMLCTLLIPPIAIVLGALFRGEALPAHALSGFGLIALGLAVLDGRLLGALHRLAPRLPRRDGH